MLLLYLTAAYVIGLLAARTVTPPVWHPALPALLAAVWLVLRRGRTGHLLLGLLLMACGYSNYHLQRAPPHNRIALDALQSPTPLTCYGQLLRVADRPDGGRALDLQIHHVQSNRRTTPVFGRVRLYLDASDRRFRQGDSLAVRARLRPPRRFGTPGEFDFPHYLALNGLQATAFLADDSGIVVLAEGRTSLPERLRETAGRLIDRSLPDRERAALVKALVTGDKGGISQARRRRLSELGLSHMFSISGFHLGLLGILGYGMLLTLVRRSERLMLLVPPRRLLPLLLVPVLGFYLLLTGQALPTMRAWLAAATVAGLLWMRRECRPVQTALAVAAAMLAATPLALFSPSFQLTCAGVFGILILVPRWSRHLPRQPVWRRRLCQLPMVTVAASLATGPLTLWHFHIAAPAGIPNNILAGPVIGWLAIPMGLAGLALAPLWPAGAAACFRGTAAILDATLNCCAGLADLPLLAPHRLYLSAPAMILLTLMVGILLCPPGRWKLAAWAILAIIWLGWPAPCPDTLRLVALSVGQGDALLATLPDGRHFLIDGGGSAHTDFDPGERLVAPALGRLGVRRLAAVVLSHDHPDHRNGLLHILRYFPVREFWSAIPEKDLWPPLRRQLRHRGIPVRTFASGWTDIACDRQRELSVFVPSQTATKVNDRSLVFYARYRRCGLLLTGDLEETGIRQLLQATPDRPVSLLKLSHHGSRTGNPAALLGHFAPTLVFASLGYGNRFGFPHPETRRITSSAGCFLWRTDLHGSLCFEVGDHDWIVRSWRRGLFR